MELPKFLHKLCDNNLPTVDYFKINSQKLKKIYTCIPKDKQVNYFLSKVNKTAVQNKLEYRGVKLWNQISEKLKRNLLSVQKAI